MQIQAYQKYVRVSPRKLKVMISSVKQLSLPDMISTLSFINKKTAKILLKALKQARANAQQKQADLSKWRVVSIQALKGPIFKRWQPVSRGRAHPIQKPTSHVRVVMEYPEDKPAKVKNKLKTAAVVKSSAAKRRTNGSKS